MKLWRRHFITRVLGACAALAASKPGLTRSAAAASPKLSAGDETEYTMEVLSLMHAAREIKAGRGPQLAASIESSAVDHLAPLLGFDESNYTLAALYAGGALLHSSNRAVPRNLFAALKGARDKIKQVLSADCFELTICKEPGCVPWPTSLRPANVKAPSPMGWRYIVGSHCGFSWPKFWKLDCGPPIALEVCTGVETSSMQGVLSISESAPALVVPRPKPNAADQTKYALQVLSLMHVAREIKAGRGTQLANSIDASLADYLTPMVGFRETNLSLAAFYLAGQRFRASNQTPPPVLSAKLKRAGDGEVLSDGCFELMDCKEPGCVPWPTSLKPANVKAPNPMGWRYIVGSHCSFAWPKFWKLDCGPPIALQPCTGDDTSSMRTTVLDQETYVPPTSDPNGYIVGTVNEPNTTGPSGFVYAMVDEQGKRTNHTGMTDGAKRFAIHVPAGIALIQVAKRLDEHGNLYKPAECKVGRGLPVPGLRDVLNPPPSGPAIVGGNSSWERGKLVGFRTRGIDPRNVRLQLEGNPEGHQIFAASNSSVLAGVKTTPGTHVASLVSGGTTTNGVASDFLDVTPTLTGSTQVGGTKVAALAVVGLPAEHPATCTFTVSGASVFEGGKSQTTVPVLGGRATAQLRNVRAGETLLRWQLTVKIPGVWD
jgi:hypothetical protein